MAPMEVAIESANRAGDPAPLAAWIDRPSLTGVGKGDHGDAAAGVHRASLARVGKGDHGNAAAGVHRASLARVGERNHRDAAAGVHRASLAWVGKGDHRDAAAGRSAGAGLGEMTHGMDRARREAAGPASFLFDAPSYSRFRGLVRRKGPGCKTALRAIRRAVKVLFQIRPRRSGRGPAAPGPCRGRR